MTEYLVRASALEGFAELVAELGGDTDNLRRAAGLPVTPLPADGWISYRAFLNLLELSAKECACPHFGLHLSRHQGIGILGPLGFIMREAPDVATALAELSRYFSLHNQGAEISLSRVSGAVQLGFESKVPGHLPMGQQ